MSVSLLTDEFERVSIDHHDDASDNMTLSTGNILDLPEVLLGHCLLFVPQEEYRFTAGVCTAFRDACNGRENEEKKTTWDAVASSTRHAEFCLVDEERRRQDFNDDDTTRRNRTKPLDQVFILKKIAVSAARTANTDMVEWASSRSLNSSGFDNDDWQNEVFAAAVEKGQIRVLEWAQENAIDWYSNELLVSAAEFGCIRVLDYLWEFLQAHGNREQISVLIWARCSMVASRGAHEAVLKWFQDKSVFKGYMGRMAWQQAWFVAARAGQVQVLQWLHDNGHNYVNYETITQLATEGGHVSIWEWMREYGVISWSPDACKSAARHGQLHVLQWLRQNGCPWDGQVIGIAKSKGYEHIVEWARANGCPEPH